MSLRHPVPAILIGFKNEDQEFFDSAGTKNFDSAGNMNLKLFGANIFTTLFPKNQVVKFGCVCCSSVSGPSDTHVVVYTHTFSHSSFFATAATWKRKRERDCSCYIFVQTYDVGLHSRRHRR